MSRVLTFGEMLMRLQPADGKPVSQTGSYNVFYGGAEANVAIGLSHLGHQVSYVTALPDGHPIAKAMILHLQKAGVKTDAIIRKGGRIGSYYLEPGVSLKAANVVYDRSHTSVLRLADQEIDWPSLFSGKDWLHITGITSALSESMHHVVLATVKAAQSAGVKVSFDFNYRSKLWPAEEAAKAYKEILPYVDHVFAGWKDFTWLFGWKIEGDDYEAQLESFYHKLSEDYGVTTASSTQREILSSGKHRLNGYYFADGKLYSVDPVSFDVIDRVGGGDSFAAGILHGMMRGEGTADMIRFALYYSVLTHLIIGDQSDYTEIDVAHFMANQLSDVSR
ncbi:sugar kinase [Bacillus sp. A116_S68]|nr:sugar kinase [Bacillus sp. A116_S68]